MRAPGPLPDAIRPAFSAPGVHALMSTRAGGVGADAFESLNLRQGLGDDEHAVAENQVRFNAALVSSTGGEQPSAPVWLRQVHGTRVVRLPLAADDPEPPAADASVTTEPGVVCAVQVADCLPVLFAVNDGRGVGAAHAGWRGLAGGVLEATVAALCEACSCAPADIEAWLGPCIGPRQFEVGPDVLAGFGVAADQASIRFTPASHGKWLADLPGLARDRLAALGVGAVSGAGWCTVEDLRFFSFRRDTRLHGRSGRMAAAIWFERRR